MDRLRPRPVHPLLASIAFELLLLGLGAVLLGQLRPELLQLSSLVGGPEVAAGVKAFPPYSKTFSAPVEVVLRAVAGKYRPPRDPLNRHVTAVEWDSRAAGGAPEIQPGRVCSRTVTLETTTTIPYLARKAAGVPDAFGISERFEWQPRERALYGVVTNVHARNLAVFQEVSCFSPDPSNAAGATLYRSWLEIGCSGWAGQKLMRALPLSSEEILRKHVAAIQARVDELQGRVPQRR